MDNTELIERLRLISTGRPHDTAIAAAERIEALQAEVERLSLALVEESGRASGLEDEVRKWVDNKRRSDVRAEALKAEVERLKQKWNSDNSVLNAAYKAKQAAEAKAGNYRKALERIEKRLFSFGHVQTNLDRHDVAIMLDIARAALASTGGSDD